MIGGRAANSNAPGAANDGGGHGGGNHLHLHASIIQNPRQLERWFERNAHQLGQGARRFVRNGGNIGPNR
jgi:hypothetical protein